MELVVTQEHLDMARKAGACRDGLRIKVGTPLQNIPAEYLAWIEEKLPDLSRAIAAEASVQCKAMLRGVLRLTSFGYGSGYGYGYGYGSGYGSGYGYGYGDGSGDGSGYGSGYGYGYGYGDGSGYGSGYGYGYGYGDGSGSGSGYGAHVATT